MPGLASRKRQGPLRPASSAICTLPEMVVSYRQLTSSQLPLHGCGKRGNKAAICAFPAKLPPYAKIGTCFPFHASLQIQRNSDESRR